MAGSAAQPPHLLVVEDDAEIREALILLLGDEGYLVNTASSLDEALALIDEQVFALILTDLFRHTRHNSLNSVIPLRERAYPTPVGVMTAWQLSPEEVTGQGFAFLMSKPYDLDAFLAAIAAALDTPLNANQRRQRLVVQRYFDALNRRDWDALADLCAERVTYVLPGSTPFSATTEGRSAFHAYTLDTFRHFPVANFDDIAVFVTPNGLAARYRVRFNLPDAGEITRSGSVLFQFDGDDQISQIGVRLNDERFSALLAPAGVARAPRESSGMSPEE